MNTKVDIARLLSLSDTFKREEEYMEGIITSLLNDINNLIDEVSRNYSEHNVQNVVRSIRVTLSEIKNDAEEINKDMKQKANDLKMAAEKYEEMERKLKNAMESSMKNSFVDYFKKISSKNKTLSYVDLYGTEYNQGGKWIYKYDGSELRWVWEGEQKYIGSQLYYILPPPFRIENDGEKWVQIETGSKGGVIALGTGMGQLKESINESSSEGPMFKAVPQPANYTKEELDACAEIVMYVMLLDAFYQNGFLDDTVLKSHLDKQENYDTYNTLVNLIDFANNIKDPVKSFKNGKFLEGLFESTVVIEGEMAEATNNALLNNIANTAEWAAFAASPPTIIPAIIINEIVNSSEDKQIILGLQTNYLFTHGNFGYSFLIEDKNIRNNYIDNYDEIITNIYSNYFDVYSGEDPDIEYFLYSLNIKLSEVYTMNLYYEDSINELETEFYNIKDLYLQESELLKQKEYKRWKDIYMPDENSIS